MALEVTVDSVRGLKSTDAPRVVPQVSHIAPQASLAFEIKHRSGIFESDSAYFWTREWEEDEREADEDIRAGRVTRFDNADEGIQYLWDLIGAEEEA